VGRVGASDIGFEHPYYASVTKPKQAGMIFVAGDRGLCGRYNRNVTQVGRKYIDEVGCQVQVIAVGQKACLQARRLGWNLVQTYPELADMQDPNAGRDAAAQIRAMFDDGEFEVLQMAYTEFHSATQWEAVLEQILPLPKADIQQDDELEYIFEPDAPQFLETLLPMAVEARIVYNLVQALAAEHAARMLAMRSASDNAEDMKDRLRRRLNRARQQKITREVLDIITGAEALGQGS
ncbi:MAG: F0F1 ATP synthase subunit gamma, partial [Armatimonadota bacterium]